MPVQVYIDKYHACKAKISKRRQHMHQPRGSGSRNRDQLRQFDTPRLTEWASTGSSEATSPPRGHDVPATLPTDNSVRAIDLMPLSGEPKVLAECDSYSSADVVASNSSRSSLEEPSILEELALEIPEARQRLA
jgi:hypothetical protein